LAGRAASLGRLALVSTLLAGATACGKTSARDGELLPGRTRPLLEHGWAHPRDLRFADNRFEPFDPQAALVVTPAGLRAYVVPAAPDTIVQVTAVLPLGRMLEGPAEAGAAELLFGLLSRQLRERLGEEFNGRIQMEQDVDTTTFSLQTLAGEWRQALSAVIGTLREPRLDPAAIGMYRTGPGYAAQTRGLGGAAFRPAIELARLTAGYPVAPADPGVTPPLDAVRNLASRSLGPTVVAVGVGGGVARDDAVRALIDLTSGWSGTETVAALPPTRTSAAASSRVRTIDEAGFTTWVALGHPLPAIKSEDEAAVAVMTVVLNVRLNIVAREMRGLANQIVLQVPATTRHGGLLHVRTGARPESIAPLIHYTVQELTRIRGRDGLATSDELEQAKGGLVLSQWQRSLDGARATASTYALETVRHGSLDRLLRWPATVRAVTDADVLRVATTYLTPDKAGVVIIGQLESARNALHPRWPFVLDEVLKSGTFTGN
jgi:predicted Zn-dependent peptidase